MRQRDKQRTQAIKQKINEKIQKNKYTHTHTCALSIAPEFAALRTAGWKTLFPMQDSPVNFLVILIGSHCSLSDR
jgi:hypothetical protein